MAGACRVLFSPACAGHCVLCCALCGAVAPLGALPGASLAAAASPLSCGACVVLFSGGSGGFCGGGGIGVGRAAAQFLRGFLCPRAMATRRAGVPLGRRSGCGEPRPSVRFVRHLLASWQLPEHLWSSGYDVSLTR